MRGQSIFATGIALEMVLETCYECGVPFAMPVEFRRRLLEKGRAATYYCLNGHGQCYTKSTTEKLEDANRANSVMQAQLTQAYADFARTSNALARLRKKVKSLPPSKPQPFEKGAKKA